MSHTARCAGKAFLLALILMAISDAQGRAEEIRQDALIIPVVISGSGGSSSVKLEAIVVRPDDNLPHPLAVFNHGSPRSPSDRPKTTPYRMWAQAMAFARRGFVAVAFLRRGYGFSGGGLAEDYGSCSNPDYATAGPAGPPDLPPLPRFIPPHPHTTKANRPRLAA